MTGVGVSALATLLLGACGAQHGAGSPDGADGPQVVASFYPLAFVAQQVAGDDASVENLTQPGVDSHGLELDPQQVAQVVDADLMLLQDGFQPAVDEATAQNAEGHVLDATDVVDLRPAPGHDHDHEQDHEQDEGEHGTHQHGDHAGHDHELDPHQWLDPANMIALTEAVSTRLAEIDPERAEGYQQRGEELVSDLQALDHQYTTGLAACERDVVVTSHNAFGYLGEAYGLRTVGVAGLEADAEPSPAAITEVAELVETEGVTTIFHERLVSPAVAEALAAETGVETAVLDPIEGLSEQTADEDYLSLMQSNLAALRSANDCS